MSTEHDSNGTSDIRAQLISVAVGVAARFLFTLTAKAVEVAVDAFKRKHPSAPPQPETLAENGSKKTPDALQKKP